MTEQEILEFNIKCAKFLKWYRELYEGVDIIEISSNELIDYLPSNIYGRTMNGKYQFFPSLCKFHSDWNWIMEIVEAIEKTYDDFHGFFGVHISSNGCTIQGTKLRTSPENFHPAYFNSVTSETKKESTILAINLFLIWYEQNNQKNN